MQYDAVIVGGGPAGLSAALTLGRATKRVLLCDAGPRRNAAAQHIHNFVTRDGTPPEEFRSIGREQLATYSNVEIRREPVQGISGTKSAFEVSVGNARVRARRILLCTGLVDEMPSIDGFAQLWGHSIVSCPYCHGWEVRAQRWGYLARAESAGHFLPFVLQLRGWTRDVVMLTGGEFALDAEARQRLGAAGIRLETSRIERLVSTNGKLDEIRLDAIQLEGGRQVPCDVLFTHPPQRQTELVRTLGLELDADGFITTDPQTRQTSIPGVYAAGDATTRMQAAAPGAAAGLQAAVMLNHELTLELVAAGAL